MKLFLLLTDLIILAGYFVHALLTYQAISLIVTVLLFFFAARVLALSVHPAFTAINVALMYFLLPYHPEILLVCYLLYGLLHGYLLKKERQTQELTRENTRLQMERKNSLRYHILKENYDSQMALNLRLEERRDCPADPRPAGPQPHRLHPADGSGGGAFGPGPGKAKSMLSHAAGMLRTGITQVREAVHQMQAEVPTLKQEEMQGIIDRSAWTAASSPTTMRRGTWKGCPRRLECAAGEPAGSPHQCDPPCAGHPGQHQPAGPARGYPPGGRGQWAGQRPGGGAHGLWRHAGPGAAHGGSLIVRSAGAFR